MAGNMSTNCSKPESATWEFLRKVRRDSQFVFQFSAMINHTRQPRADMITDACLQSRYLSLTFRSAMAGFRSPCRIGLSQRWFTTLRRAPTGSSSVAVAQQPQQPKNRKNPRGRFRNSAVMRRDLIRR